MRWDSLARTFLWSLGLLLVLTATAAPSFAQPTPTVPEIDAGTMGSAVALLTGGYLILASKYRRK